MSDYTPCIKKPVRAALRLPDGRAAIGENYRSVRSEVCPREEQGCETGEGYNLCQDVCKQIGHAEVVALEQFNHKAEGGIMTLFGHTYACDNCIDAMIKAGVHILVVYDTGEEFDLKQMAEDRAGLDAA